MDNVSEDEQLPVTSRINGITYNRFDVQECFECNGPFTDEHGLLRLSDIQNQCFQHWLRPDKFSRSLLDSPRVVHSVGPAFIIQTFTHDCSFVASLTSCAQYELRFGKPLLTSKIFPKNSTSKPIYNPCGKYVIRLSVNGAWRKVVIDDLFPVGEKKKLLCSHSRNGDIWVSLLEKAYMKVMGGYDIADSFPHIDTHVLTGWIPECVPVNMESKDFSAKLMYEGIYRWFNRGQCLFNIATGEISKSESERMGLPQFHTYAVIELRKFKDKRFLLLKDPSIHPSSSWKGKYSDADLESWTSELCEALRHYPTAAQQLRDGMFWIDYESVCHFFDFFYLNWNPRIFPYSFGLHAQWSVVANSAKDLNIGVDNPQYSLEIIGNGRPCAVWILLTRHIVERDDFPTSEGSIGVVIFKLRDESDSLITSPPILYPNFTRTSHLLTKMAVREAGIYSYLLVVAQKEKLRTIRYTLRIYSAVQFRLRKVKKSYTFEKLEIGKWKGKSVGGSGNGLSKATYRENAISQRKSADDSDGYDSSIKSVTPNEDKIEFTADQNVEKAYQTNSDELVLYAERNQIDQVLDADTLGNYTMKFLNDKASRNSRLMDNASYLASKAVDFDKCGRGDIAICFYQDAATAIYELIRTEEVPESCGSVAEGYEARAVFLKSQLESQRKKIINKTEHQLCLERIEFLLYQALEYDEGNCSDEAISLYTEAVDFCLKSNFSTHTETGRKLRDLMRKALDRAECLKYLSDSQRLLNVISIPTPLVDEISNLKVSNEIMPPSHPASLSHEKSGATNDRLDTEEILVLTATSCINGRKYLPFMNIDLRERFAFPVPFTDRDGHLILSDKQRKHFKLWLRPDQLMESPNVVDMIDSGVIKQTIVSDCSFVASLAISARYEQRFGKRLVTSIIYPQNKDGQPIYNPCGKYMMKLHVNGIWRKVIIDDYFPVGENGQLLCSYNQKKSDIWVSLLEKAYMKVMGGYDFPGSNSSIDMHALTGWIPERIALKSESTSSDAISIFEKLFSRFHHGHCLVTLATGNMGKIDSDRSGLVETHAYAVLDFRKIGDKRLLLLKNPWTHLRWKGKYSDVDRIRWTPELCEALNYDPADARQFDDGIFWIDYDSVCHFFDVFYVNWNPKIFPYSFGLHAMWSAGTSPVKDLYSVAENPQYMLEISNKNGSCAVWILLTRHITEKEDFANNREYITVMIFKSGEKIYSPISPRPIMDPVRINSPHHLSQMVIDEAGTQRYSLVVAQYEKMKTIYYTLKVYSTAKFRLQKIKSPYIYKKQEIGEWKGKTAGGCGNGLSKTTYRDNPIFQLTLGEDSDENDLLVELKGPKEYSVGFEVQLVSSYRGKAFQLRDSGAFRPGYCVLALKSVTGGTYNIQPMTFLHGQEGPFFLNVECSSICTLKRVQ